jgi:hypothetical protein
MSIDSTEDSRLRILFVPVSGPRGMGEYARSLAIASAVTARWPDARIHFVLSREAPYAATTPFPHTLLPSSPTFHSKDVDNIIREFRPTVVVFDNAGRSAQLHSAVRSGARLVFVSSRVRQRRRAFRLRWMKLIDEHWIAWPRFIAGDLTGIESLKLRIAGRPTVRFFDTMLPLVDPAADAAVLAKFSLRAHEFAVVVPGGGTDHRGAENAPNIVATAAHRIAASGHTTILVGVDPATVPGGSSLVVTPRLPMEQLTVLIRNATVVISNGGDTLLQALSCHRPCVAVAIAGDQGYRIEKSVNAGLAVRAELTSESLAGEALALLNDSSRRDALTQRLATYGIINGLSTALDALHTLAMPEKPDLKGARTTE